jgi:hypothetical protein
MKWLDIIVNFVFKPDGLFLLQSIKKKQKSCQKITLVFFQSVQLARLTDFCRCRTSFALKSAFEKKGVENKCRER